MGLKDMVGDERLAALPVYVVKKDLPYQLVLMISRKVIDITTIRRGGKSLLYIGLDVWRFRRIADTIFVRRAKGDIARLVNATLIQH